MTLRGGPADPGRTGTFRPDRAHPLSFGSFEPTAGALADRLDLAALAPGRAQRRLAVEGRTLRVELDDGAELTFRLDEARGRWRPDGVPATPRDSQARGNAPAAPARSASAMPGAARSRIAVVASGVTSRAVSPVPPVVRIASTSPESAQRTSFPAIRSGSSGTTLRTTTS